MVEIRIVARDGLHIRALAPGDLAARVKPYLVGAGYTVDEATLLKIIPLIQERLTVLTDAPEIAGFYFKETVEPDPQDLVAKGLTPAQSAEVARRAHEVLSALPDMSVEIIEPPMRALVEEMGLSSGQVFGILRAAVTGQKVSPPLFESMAVIGREKVLERIRRAVDLLEEKAKA